ncbi:MAG: sterol desaturase family protein [Formosimonas sp.]
MNLPNLAAPLLLMLLLTFAEIIFRARVRHEPAPWRDVVFNLNSGHIVLWFFRTAEILAFAAILTHWSTNWVAVWPSWLQWLFGFVAWDACFYWMHRLHHKIPLLWAVHVVHHQGEHFNLSLGIRNSWYSSLSNFPFVAILAVLGLPVELFVVVSSIHYSVQFYNHNGLVGRSGWLDAFLVTPLHHRVHHGMDEPYIDKNFGGTLLLWDYLFGTFQTQVADVPLRFGTHTPMLSHNPWVANHQPFFKARQMRSSNIRLPLPDAYIARAGFVLFLTVIAYVFFDGTLPTGLTVAWFALMVVSTIAIGALSDEQTWGIGLWLLSALLLSMGILLNATHLMLYVLSSILFAHSVETVYRLIKSS